MTRARAAFTLIELLVTLAVIATLVGIMLPSLSGARDAARIARCLSNQRQLATAWAMYAGTWQDRAMPLAYWSSRDIGAGQQVFWWGTHGTGTTPPDHARGFIAPHLDAALRERSVFECPEQPWGTYRPQGPSRTITSTYGYNGYYLSPSKTPGWAFSIGHRPWQRLSSIDRPSSLLVFADALLPAARGLPSNTALLDPPMLFDGTGWSTNASPTTAFRHGKAPGRAAAAMADGHAAALAATPESLTHPAQRVGSVGGEAGLSRYVPDADSWTPATAGY